MEEDLHFPKADRIHLLTLHAAKGLEWPVVFLCGCEEGLLPFHLPGRQTDIAEERRLFYVGMTRARETLFISHARKRTSRTEQSAKSRPSRFLGEIDTLWREELVSGARKPSQMSLF
jgi:DNA helicase II / ATP-dependent DNA helicase PcrA